MANTNTHSFNIDDAIEYGVHEAILLYNITYWAKYNKANGKNYYEVDPEQYPKLSGQKRYFTYNSIKAFSELFPYFSVDQIRLIIKKLCEKGVLIKGCYNKSSYDRTIWYALYDEKSIGVITQDHLVEIPNEFGRNPKPIPDINTDVNSGINIISRTIALLNEKSNSKYQPTRKSTVAVIKARLAEKFTETDLSLVVVSKSNQWLNDPKMSAFLRPETLFGNKFEGYLNEALRAAAKPKGTQESIQDKVAAAAATSEFNQK
jgi:uncharacterized phage protein (TIGR02220 family)